ncbi:MAG TPA: glycosyltransferase family 4 protein [Candidatus Sulfotelmatobacter sp.]
MIELVVRIGGFAHKISDLSERDIQIKKHSMKILWVKPGKLLPLDSGGKLRTYNILRHLSAAHQLTYLSYYGGQQDKAYEHEILNHLPGAVCLCTGATDSTIVGRGLDYFYRLFSSAPYAVSKFTAPQVQQLLSRWIAQPCSDVAVCDFLASSLNFPQNLLTPTALFQHNVETVLWRRRAEMEVEWWDRTIAKIEYAKMRRFEPAQVRRFHHVIAVSDADRKTMSSMVDPSRISVVPTGVDLSQFRYDPNHEPREPLVIFTGSMDWKPNIDGVEFFCKEIWPLILARIPKARFRIVGRDPHSRVRDLASASIEVTGNVPSIIEHLRESAVFVVPLRIGGGTRIKIYEAMAMGKATVSTTIGAEGLDVNDGRDILLADDTARFADSVCSLLLDREMRRRLEKAAAATAAQYDWSAITERFVEALQLTIEAAAGAQVTVPSVR